jgi:hypothetical protein
MDKWLNQLFMLLKSPVGEAEIPDVKPPLSVVDSQELGFFFTLSTKQRYNMPRNIFHTETTLKVKFVCYAQGLRNIQVLFRRTFGCPKTVQNR